MHLSRFAFSLQNQTLQVHEQSNVHHIFSTIPQQSRVNCDQLMLTFTQFISVETSSPKLECKIRFPILNLKTVSPISVTSLLHCEYSVIVQGKAVLGSTAWLATKIIFTPNTQWSIRTANQLHGLITGLSNSKTFPQNHVVLNVGKSISGCGQGWVRAGINTV